MKSVYASLGQPIAVYGHIHQPFVRSVRSANGVEILVANAGGVSMSYDGDRRASYLLVDGSEPLIRRVEYDLEKELDGLRASGLPHSDWVVRTLLSGFPQAP